ncbi:hypothetical protein TSUD_132510 [Trifolium subterraneum]|uniref:F-box domain-containing protein n=1 Tax=Trifolium subterraneum TaxID=3900 RepID=A0A2Z6LRG9_TRISU|nr:hypothetical protein TSUD_132510 [Trifolium subterraneum]
MSPERESCNSRHFTWFIKSCFPNPNDTTKLTSSQTQPHPTSPTHATTISSLPDDIVLNFLSRLPSSSLSSLSFVCRRWSHLLHSPHFSDLRRNLHLLRHTLFSLTATDFGFSFSTVTLHNSTSNSSLSLPYYDAVSILSQARIASIGPRIFIVGRNATVKYDTWTETVSSCSGMIFPRKKFALAAVAGKIYIAGGSSRTDAVEEYDLLTNTWSVVAHAPRRRYGCIGASSDGVFYVIGGLRIGASEKNEFSRANLGAEAYASSMDLFEVEGRTWLKSRTVPGGGCVVAGCAAAGKVYLLTSHTVEVSFWSFDAKRKCGGGRGAGGAFGEWVKLTSPRFPVQVRVDSRIRFSCLGMGDKVVLIQVGGCVLNEERRRGSSREGFVLVYDCGSGEWERGIDLLEIYRRAAYVGVEC